MKPHNTMLTMSWPTSLPRCVFGKFPIHTYIFLFKKFPIWHLLRQRNFKNETNLPHSSIVKPKTKQKWRIENQTRLLNISKYNDDVHL